MKKLVIGAAAMALAFSASTASAVTINVGVAANFSGALTQIIDEFKAAHSGTSYTFNVTIDSTGNLQNNITTALNSNINSSPYDVFLAADDTSPAYLRLHYATVVAAPFEYAQGSLLLYSNNVVDVSSGLPVPLTQDTLIADPVAAPYGTAAKELLHNTFSINLPATHVVTDGNIGTTFASIQAKTYPMGFIAKSQLCFGGQVDPGLGTYFEYTTGYSDIIQDGTIIARTGAATADVASFVAFLRADQGAIEDFCYIYPSSAARAKAARKHKLQYIKHANRKAAS